MSAPRERILAAASQVFGRKGYKAATVRRICDVAGVNVAALNYYFGTKETLYRTVVTELLKLAIERYPADMGVVGKADAPEKRLRMFVRAMLYRFLAPGGIAGCQAEGRLLARELADPSPLLDTLVHDHIRPQAKILGGIIAELIGENASHERVMKSAFSVIGQCFYYGYAWPITNRLHPLDLGNPVTIENLADHIANFSLYGLKER